MSDQPTPSSSWQALHRLIDSLEKGDYQDRAPELPGEAGIVAARLNHLADKLEQKSTLNPAFSQSEIAFKERIVHQILNNLGHEIRTPLNAILGFSRLLLQELRTSETHDYAFNIYDSAENLLVIVNDLLDLARLEQGEFQLDEEHFNLQEVLHISQRLLALKVEEKGLRLKFETDPNLPEALIGDRPRILQLISNLVDNAIKFTEKGNVLVRTTCQANEDSTFDLKIAVTDSGIGIPADKMQSIFTGFTQVSGAHDRKYGGTGMGLTICHRIITMMGGSIDVESSEGKGSTFTLTFRLPAGDPKQVVNRPVAAVNASRLAGAQILLVEDNRNNQILARKVLEDRDMVVTVAGNGLEALDLMKFNDFDLILMDIQMPEMDGIEATRLIRGLPDSKSQIPIIAVTAHALRHEIRKYKKAGVDEYVPKPFQPESLYAAIEELLFPEDVKPDEEEPLDLGENGRATNLRNLKQLALGDDAFLSDMIQVFLEDVPEHLIRLRTALEMPNWEDLKQMAHKLKGPTEMMGVRKAVSLLDQIEFFDDRSAKAPASLVALVEELESVCAEALRELNDELLLLT